MLEKRLREQLAQHLKHYVKWFDDYDPTEMPNDETIRDIYRWMSSELQTVVELKHFSLLFTMRLTHYRETKKGNK